MSTTRAHGQATRPARPEHDPVEHTGSSRIPRFDLADRMRKTLREADVSVQDMAEYLEVSRNTVGSWINGKTRPSAAALKLWALRVGIPYEWIKNGKSPQTVGSGGSDGLPRLDLNQRPSDYTSSLVACPVRPLRGGSGTARARRVRRFHAAGEAA